MSIINSIINHQSGQIIIFHQPRFPWNKGISLTKPPFAVRSCEVAIIWPDQLLPTVRLHAQVAVYSTWFCGVTSAMLEKNVAMIFGKCSLFFSWTLKVGTHYIQYNQSVYIYIIYLYNGNKNHSRHCIIIYVTSILISFFSPSALGQLLSIWDPRITISNLAGHSTVKMWVRFLPVFGFMIFMKFS